MDESEDLYRIGTVAKMTGIAVERLRAWERRYGLEPARRSGKTRYYNDHQVAQLRKIKALTDSGHAISSLVPLSDAQLDARLETVARGVDRSGAARIGADRRPVSIGLAGAGLIPLQAGADADPTVTVVDRHANVEALLAVDETPDANAFVVQFPVMDLVSLQQAQDVIGDAQLIALYQFALPEQLQAAEEFGAKLLRWPARWDRIVALCRDAARGAQHHARPHPRGYTDDELIAIAASDTDPAGCMTHLVELINSLNAFASFAGAREQDALDQVSVETTHARAQLELALSHLLGAKG